MSLFSRILTSPPDNFKKRLTIQSPLSGRVLPLNDMPSLVHNERLLGEGVTVSPSGYQILAPFHCRIESLPATGDHIKLRSAQGFLLNIQVGINTARLHGEGFKFYAKAGAVLQQGQKILEFNLNKLKAKADSPLCAITLLNSDKVLGIEPHYRQAIALDDPIFSIYL